MRRILLATLLFTAPLLGEGCCFAPELIVSGQGGNFRRGGGAEGWVPVAQRSDRVIFVQGGAGYFRHQGVGSLGLGFRQQLSSKLAIGINGFGDLAFTERGSTFGQLGAGVEVLGCRTLFRANGYFPISPRHIVSSRPGVALDGTRLIDLSLLCFETPLYGMDLEFGGEVNVKGGELWAYGGYFYYGREGLSPTQGPRVRAEYRYNCLPFRAQLLVGGWYEWDRYRHSTGSAYLEIRFPFRSNSCPASICDLMGRKVYRERAIWVQEGPGQRVNGPLNQLIFANELIDGTGTQTNPATIDNAFALAGAGDIVFLLQNTGNMTPAGTITLNSEEQVLGFGNSSQVTLTLANGAKLTITDLTGAGRGVVAGGLLNPIFMTDSDNLFQGIELLGGSVGILQSATFEGLTVEDLIFDTQVTQGIVNMGGSFSVADSQFMGAPTSILSMGSTGIQEIRRSSFQGGNGIQFNLALVDHALIANCSFATTADAVDLITCGGTFVLYQSEIGGGVNGLFVNDLVIPGSIKDVRVLESSLMGLTGRAVYVIASQAADTYVVQDNNIVGITLESVRFDLNRGPLNVLISDNSFTSLAASALFMDVDTDALILIENNEGTSSPRFLDVDFGGTAGFQGNVTMQGNTQFNNTALQSYRVARTAGVQPVCATLLNNDKVVTTSGILIDSTAVTPIFVFDLPNLSANNNNLTVTIPGGDLVLNTPTPCPLPTIPPLPFTP